MFMSLRLIPVALSSRREDSIRAIGSSQSMDRYRIAWFAKKLWAYCATSSNEILDQPGGLAMYHSYMYMPFTMNVLSRLV
jgi:hypothetical protein